MSELVLFEVQDGIATLTINRPDKLNALDLDVLSALHEAVHRLSEPGLRCAILTGAGKAFVAGADISQMRDLDVNGAREFAKRGHEVLANIEAAPIPVIAAVNGYALGGGTEIALACDFIHASAKARFGQPEVKLGVIPGFGGTQRLARRVGIGMARELVYSGKIIKADEALRIGLANAVHEPDALLGAVGELAREIGKMGPFAVAVSKRVMRDGEEKPLPEANALEIEGFAECFGTSDQTEGMSAFLDKREASFTGD